MAERLWCEVSPLEKNIVLLIGQGARIYQIDGRLRYSAPTGVLDQKAVHFLESNRIALVSLLRERGQG